MPDKSLTYAIIPARSGSKGVANKNIKDLNGLPLLVYSINFAKSLGVDRIICSTDSEDYAKIARQYGAEVPFLRSSVAAADTAMEHQILQDLYEKFEKHKIPNPDYLIWLRPTFVFRDKKAVVEGLQNLQNNPEFTSARTVVESESRLYEISENGLLEPTFDSGGKSMIRRQDIGTKYKVYSTDIIRFNKDNLHDEFLGNKVYPMVVNKVCGLDIDDEFDFNLVEAILKNAKNLVDDYLYTD